MIEYLAPLKFVWDVLKPAMSDSVKERIKTKGSNEIAKKRSLRLYQELGKISRSIDDFIVPLAAYVQIQRQIQIPSQPLADGEFTELILERVEITREVGRRCEDIVAALIELADTLQEINPQLEIHKPQLVEMLEIFGVSESIVTRRVEVIPWGASWTELSSILNDAEENRKILHKAIKDYREFIAKEFPFKDSF